MRRLATLCLAVALPVVSQAQGVTDRPPVLSGDWVGVPGIIYFNFVHRFSESGAPEHKVTNTPTFVLAAALPWYTLLGTTYATNSQLVARFPNEHEYFLRVAPLSQSRGAPVDLGIQGGYNDAAQGADGEVSLAREAGPLRLLAAARVLSTLSDSSRAGVALAGGAVLHLTRYIALSGDVGGLTKRNPSDKLGWSAGLQLAIPLTPHTFSVQATNVNSNTLQGSSHGTSQVRYGFEFTIPLTLRRYFGPRAPEAPPPPSGAGPVGAGGPVTTVRIQGMSFHRGRIEVAAGTTVEFKNDDPLGHTVTATDGSFNSPLIEPGRSWSHTFDKPGEYPFHCTPHPFMTGVVVVH